MFHICYHTVRAVRWNIVRHYFIGLLNRMESFEMATYKYNNFILSIFYSGKQKFFSISNISIQLLELNVSWKKKKNRKTFSINGWTTFLSIMGWCISTNGKHKWRCYTLILCACQTDCNNVCIWFKLIVFLFDFYFHRLRLTILYMRWAFSYKWIAGILALDLGSREIIKSSTCATNDVMPNVEC